MGVGKIVKRLAALICMGLMVLLCLSGPFHAPDSSVRPLFGTVKVQLSSGKYPVDTKTLTAVIQKNEVEALDLFDNLVAVDLSGSTCYAEIAAWAQANPQVQVKYTVTLPDGSIYDNSTVNVDLSSLPAGTAAAAADALEKLPALESVSLGNVGGAGSGLSLADVATLRAALPNVSFDFTLNLLGQSVSPDVTSLDLSSLKSEQVEEAATVLSCLSSLKEVKLKGESDNSPLTWEDIGRLAAACPSASFDYSFTLYGKEVNLSDEKLDFNHTAISDEGAAVRQVLPYMTKCTYLDMDYCGVSNEAMATIRDENPNVEVVWRIWFGENYSVRTDTERILASKPTVGGMIYDGSVLQYCTKVKYLDLGHNDDLSDISFVSSMPELEVFIVAMTNITDISPLANCPKLEYLEIQTTEVADLSPLAGLTDLAHLNICEMPNVTDITPLYGLNKLERLWIGTNTPVPEEQVSKIKSRIPNCTVNTTAYEPHAEAWRYSRYDPEEPKYYWVPRYELLREQMGYNYQEYSFYWLDPLCGDPAPAEFAGMFGKEVYGIS